MVFADSAFASAVSPYQNPVPPLLVDPSEAANVSVCFRSEWIPFITGALQTLVLQATWDTNDAAILQEVQNFAQQLISMFQTPDACPIPGQAVTGASEELMIRQNPTNPCLLETSIDGTNWCAFADLSKCLGTPNQTGSETIQPRPGGGTQCYNTELDANGGYWIPVPLNAGDVVDITFSDGLWGDPASPLPRCPDGTIFIGQGCVTGTEFTHAGDPMATKPHMSIIVDIAGTFYAQVDGPITVPGGVVNAMARVQANTDVPNDASGSASIKVCVTNNAASVWSHTFDFLTNNGGWIADIAAGGTLGFWTPGIGWTDGDAIIGANGYRGVLIHKPLTASREITGVSATFTRTAGAATPTGDFHNVALNGTEVFQVPIQNTPPNPFAFVGDVPSVTLVEVDIYCGSDLSGTDPGGTLTIQSITITGIGTDPF